MRVFFLGLLVKLGYFESDVHSHPIGKLTQASGKIISFKNIELLPIVQSVITEVIEAHQEPEANNKFIPINGFLFSSREDDARFAIKSRYF